MLALFADIDITGNPALTVPNGIGRGDLPIGLQLIGRQFGEAIVHLAGFAFQAARG